MKLARGLGILEDEAVIGEPINHTRADCVLKLVFKLWEGDRIKIYTRFHLAALLAHPAALVVMHRDAIPRLHPHDARTDEPRAILASLLDQYKLLGRAAEFLRHRHELAGGVARRPPSRVVWARGGAASGAAPPPPPPSLAGVAPTSPT